MANQEVTTNEIMEFLQPNMVTRDEFNDRVGSLEVRFDNLEVRVGHLENQMVTKDYLDDKFATFGAEIGQRINRQEVRHEVLVDVLASKSILDNRDLKRLRQ